MENKSREENILEKIEQKKIKMKSKQYFVLKNFAYLFGLILFFLFIVFISSFILFEIHFTGVGELTSFGWRGFGAFVTFFPWLLFLLVLLLIVVLELVAQRFSLVYKKPLVYSLLAILVFVSVFAFIVFKTPMHPALFKGARQGKFLFINPFYREEFLQKPGNTFMGKVLVLTNNGFVIEDERGEEFEIIISPKTLTLFEQGLEEGDLVLIMGDRIDTFIEAIGIKEIEDEFNLHFPHPRSPLK